MALEKSRKRLPQSDKLKWTTLALERARELNMDGKVSEITKRLYTIAPRLNPAPKEREFLAVAADFRQARRFKDARAYYERVIQSPNFSLDDKITAMKGIRLGYKNARNDDEHIAACASTGGFLATEFKANPKSNAVRSASYDAQVYLARALWTLGRSAEARTIFANLERRMRKRVPLAELYWLQARMAEEEKDFAKVSQLLDKALKEKMLQRLLTRQDLVVQRLERTPPGQSRESRANSDRTRKPDPGRIHPGAHPLLAG
ncbi:MAG: hypothetical protein HC902_12590 [Calothrix sp. SM1_5_4]|nr:hypothetical protein [Calothrix sp. SM1_5_4]